jgi:hypothetical protein
MVQDNEYSAHLELCTGGQAYLHDYIPLPAGWEQYVGQVVTAYMDWCCWSVQNGWQFYATAFEHATCEPLATEKVTWGQVKTLYR